MPSDVIQEAQVNTNAVDTNADVKSSGTLLGGAVTPDSSKETPEQQSLNPAEKVEGDKKAETSDADKKAEETKKPEGAPEKYEFKLPENVQLDPEAVTKANATFKELNLPQDQAQKVMDLAVEHAGKVAAQVKQQQEKALQDAGDKWKKEIETDTEYGGSNFKKSNEAAIRFRDKFTSPEERKALAPLFESGWGNFPALWKVFVRGGLSLGEDRAIDGSTETASEQSSAADLYPTMRKQ
jgi:hypothetical protein